MEDNLDDDIGGKVLIVTTENSDEKVVIYRIHEVDKEEVDIVKEVDRIKIIHIKSTVVVVELADEGIMEMDR